MTYVAANPSTGDGTDDGFLTRCAATVEAVDAAQARANAMPGLWGGDRASSRSRVRTGTHSTRAVLDALCLYMAQAAQLTVEADVRRISADTGYGRTTVHEALRRLATPTDEASPESAWIVRVGTPEGAHAQRYRLSQKFSTGAGVGNRTQVRARPADHSPLQARTQHIAWLAKNLQALAHDTFAAPRSLGRTAGLVYKHVDEGSVLTVEELTRSTGLDALRTRQALRALHLHGLLSRTDHGWTRKKAAPLTSWRKPSMSRGTSKHVERATPTNGTAGRGGRRRCNGCRGAGSDVVDAAPPRPRSCSASAIGRTIRDTPAARVEAITEPRSPS